MNLRRDYSINPIEYCRNFIFKRHFPIHKIFEHSCEMGLFRLAADKVAYSKNSTMAITCCASTAKTWWVACTRSSALSCAPKFV